MKNTLLFTFKTLFILSMAFEVNAIVAIRPNLHVGMKDGENCGMKSTQGSASQIAELSGLLHKTAWFQDRDNSMTEISTDTGVGAAMATVFTKSGRSQAIQVCPGVYLATAHGVLDDPNKAHGRDLETPSGNMYGIIPYPLSRETVMSAKSNSSYVSPRLRDAANWKVSTTDYVFIKVDKALKPNHFVRPVRATNAKLIESSNDQIEVNLYRPETRFNTDEHGNPDHNLDTWVTDFDEMANLYQSPMQVNEPCNLQRAYEGLIGSDCPNEDSVSGSPEITNIDGADFIVGMHIQGLAVNPDSIDGQVPNALIPSSEFCADYESVCGQPCVNLEEVLPQSGGDISI